MNTQHQPIRVLHVVTTMEVGGVETLLMNLYRQMDRTKIQFDFLKHRGGSDFYDDQIRALGGRIFPGIPYDPLHIQKYRAYYNRFFREHPEYRIVHAHTHYNAVVLDEARKQGVPVRIAHAHTAYPTVDKKYIFKLWNKLTVRRSCTHMMACSHPAGAWFFGKRRWKAAGSYRSTTAWTRGSTGSTRPAGRRSAENWDWKTSRCCFRWPGWIR